VAQAHLKNGLLLSDLLRDVHLDGLPPLLELCLVVVKQALALEQLVPEVVVGAACVESNVEVGLQLLAAL
jgi:hypothetical protein